MDNMLSRMRRDDTLTPAQERELNARAGILPEKPAKITLKPRDPLAKGILDALGLDGKHRKGVTFERLGVSVTQVTGLRSYWSGGSRDYYHRYNPARRRRETLTLPGAFPFDQSPDRDVSVDFGTFIVRHSYFGQHQSVTVFVRADNWDMVPWEPAATLTKAQTVVLHATSALKASYVGRKPRVDFCSARGISLEAEKPALIALKYLRRNGSITPAGRQALEENRELHGINRYDTF